MCFSKAKISTNIFNSIITFFLLCLLYITPNNTFAQQAKFNASMGISLSQIDNDGMSGYHKNGLTAGLMTQFTIKKNILWSVGMKYVNKGSKKIYGDQGPIGGNGQWEIARLQYINVPLSYTYVYKEKFYLSTGPVAGILAGGNIEFVSFTKVDARNTFKKVDVLWNFSVGYNFTKNWLLQVTTEASILSANKGNNYINVSKYSGYLNDILLIELVKVFDSK